MSKPVVFVGLSGGVDSAVSAALLKKATSTDFKKLVGRPAPTGFQGFEVVGVFMKTWHPDFLACDEEEERLDAMRVAAHLDIPFLTFDFENEYKNEVGDYMIREYRAGRTPNPDVMCNKSIKFGAFLKKAVAKGADFVATGHYARVIPAHDFSGLLQPSAGTFPVQNHKQKTICLAKGKDPAKDQSYFLWTLDQRQLSKIIFPIGALKKTEVRKLAQKYGLPVATKKDSQGICFLGEVDLKKFLKHYIKEKKGKVCNESGEVIGWHEGAVFYTLGERHGFTVTKKTPIDKPYYVVAKDMRKNILVVSSDKNLSRQGLVQAEYQLESTNWILQKPDPEKTYQAQVRYHGNLLSAKVQTSSGHNARVLFDKPTQVASGQSVVIYDEDICMGGGVVS